MLKINSPYDFYKMTQRQWKPLLGSLLTCDGNIYFPLLLTKEGSWMNYGDKQALLSLTPVRHITYSKQNHYSFVLRCFSRDDLDLGLDFSSFDKEKMDFLRDKVLKYATTMKRIGVTYKSVLEEVQKAVGAGEIGD